MVSVLLCTACNAMRRHENHHFVTVFHCFPPLFILSPVSPVFHGPGGELVTAVVVTLRAWVLFLPHPKPNLYPGRPCVCVCVCLCCFAIIPRLPLHL